MSLSDIFFYFYFLRNGFPLFMLCLAVLRKDRKLDDVSYFKFYERRRRELATKKNVNNGSLSLSQGWHRGMHALFSRLGRGAGSNLLEYISK